MLDNLLDIEVAYSLLRGGAQDNENDPIDINYEKLKTKIEVGSRESRCCCMKGHLQLLQLAVVLKVIDKSAKEADIIMQYVKNTHAATHNTYTLEVQEVSNMAALSVCLCCRSHFFFLIFHPLRSSKYAEKGSTSVTVHLKNCTTGSCCGTALAPPTTRV